MLDRILFGEQAAKLPELMMMADATGSTVARLTGSSPAIRAEFAPHAAGSPAVEKMREQLLRFVELDTYLDDQKV